MGINKKQNELELKWLKIEIVNVNKNKLFICVRNLGAEI